MFTTTQIIIGIIAVFAFAMWMTFSINVAQDQKRYPCLNRVATVGNIVIALVILAIIIKYDLWC